MVIGIVNSCLKYGSLRLEKDHIPPQTMQWIKENYKTHQEKINLSLLLTRLARLLILSNTNDHRRKVLDTGTPELSHALYLVSILHDAEVEGEMRNEMDFAKIFSRIGQWQFPLQAPKTDILGRGQLLFIDLPDLIKDKYNFDEKMKEYFGMDIFQFMVTGFALWIMTNGILKYRLNIEVDKLKNIVTGDSIEKFLSLSSGTPEDYKRYIRDENWKSSNKLRDMYFLDPFHVMPVVKVGWSLKLEPNSYIVPQPLFLLIRSSLGPFYLLSDKEKALHTEDPRKNPFRSAFGNVYREYVKQHLSLKTSSISLVDLDTEIEYEDERPDFALIEEETCVLFEVKTSILSLDCRMMFDTDKAKEEIGKNTFEKALNQLHKFEQKIKKGDIKDKRFSKIENFVKILVGFEDAYLANAQLLPLIKERYGNNFENLQIATLSDIEIIGTCLAHNGKVVSALRKKVMDTEVYKWAVEPYLLYINKEINTVNPLLDRAWKKFMKRMMGLTEDPDKIIEAEKNQTTAQDSSFVKNDFML